MKIKTEVHSYRFSIDNSSYMNMPWRRDILLNNKQIGFLDSSGIQFDEDGEDLIPEDTATIQGVWKDLNKEQLKSFHEQLTAFLYVLNIVYQDGSDYYTIDDILQN